MVITGVLTPVKTIKGSLSGVARIDCSLTPVQTMTGSLTGAVTMSGKLTIPSTIGGQYYEGEYVITPKAYEEQILDTQGLLMRSDVEVLEVPYYETSNITGTTVYIAKET